MEVNKNYINGKWTASKNNETFKQRNPADLTIVTGLWQKSTTEDTQAAIDSAQNAFASWGRLTVYQRAEYLDDGSGR